MTTGGVGPNVTDDTCAWWEATVTSGSHWFILNKADSVKGKKWAATAENIPEHMIIVLSSPEPWALITWILCPCLELYLVVEKGKILLKL